MNGKTESPATSHPSQPVSSLLATIPSLRFATRDGLRTLALATRLESVAAGTTITRQGEGAHDIFFILDGVYEVWISFLGHEPDFIRHLGTGESFGEIGVLYDAPRTATVHCTAAGHLLRIPGRAFLDALDTGR